MKLKEIIIGLSIVAAAFYGGWRLLLYEAERGVRVDFFPLQTLSSEVLLRWGGESAAVAMIEAVRDTPDDESDVTSYLMNLNERIPLNREPYLGMIVRGVLSKKTCWTARRNLVIVIEEVTGRSFDRTHCLDKNPPCKVEEHIEENVRNIREWWLEMEKTSGAKKRAEDARGRKE